MRAIINIYDERGELVRIERLNRHDDPPPEPPVEDVHVFETMKIYGGGFVKALAECGYRADSVNLAKIKQAWPDIWNEYSAWTRARLRKPEGQP